MTRRRRKKEEENIVLVFIGLPWSINLLLAISTYILLRSLLPSFLGKVPATLSHTFAPYVAVFFLVMALASFVLGRNRHSDPQEESGAELGMEQNNSIQVAKSPSPLIKSPTTDWGVLGPRGSAAPQYTEWTIELLRSLEWKRFELLAAEYFRLLGKRVETISHGSDGGIDARIYAKSSSVLEYAIQCKAWSKMVGVSPVRELFGVMAHESAGKGIFMTTSSFSPDAKQFAEEHRDKLFLIDGEKFISMILKLPEGKKAQLLAFATEGDYTTPTCASCGVKMVWRTKGNFWGCKNYPRCKSTLRVAGA